MGIYATVLSIGFALGPAVLSVTGTKGLAPFLAGSAIIAVGALPVAIARAPAISCRSQAGFLRFLFVAPAATSAALAFGFAESGSFALLPIYGERNGHPIGGVVLFAAAMTLGNVLFQLPFGFFSDRVDRRKLLLGIAALGLIGAALLPLVSGSLAGTIALLFFWGGSIGALYTVGLAHLAQRFTGADLAAANSAFVFCYASGSLVGPAALGLGMEAYDPHGFAVVLCLCFLAYLVLVAFRVGRGKDPALP
jgi:MFS family permease